MAGAGTLRQVLWIGGPPGAGKSSVETRIARRHGLRWCGDGAYRSGAIR